MAQRVALAKDLAAGSPSTSIPFRTSRPPYRVQGRGGYTGTVAIQHSVDGTWTGTDWTVSDAAATWDTIGTVSSGDAITISDPIYRLRVSGTHTGSPATVILLEQPAPFYGA